MSETVDRADMVDVPLDRDLFMRTLIGELADTLEQVVGLEEASGFVSIVGTTMGDSIDQSYRRVLQVDRLSRAQVADVLVDLKRRINGRFHVVSEDEHRIVLGNSACPFGDKVQGRSSMCMMTSNVFGTIVAENLGYARVELQRTIAAGHGECRIVVHLQPVGEAEGGDGREYFQTSR